MSSVSRLHVPHPPARPGEPADFRYLRLSPAGAVARPDVTATADSTAGLATSLVRVLNDEHRAVGPWDPHLEATDLQVGLRHMMTTRALDDRMQRAQRQGKISFYIRSTGEEAVSVAQVMALRPGDMLFPSYRQQGLHIARGRNVMDLMCQCLSNSHDMCKGRQMPIM
ncbi:MAG TPA: thiamine pyrophosphate-dependent enzyme, partial [Povalibacter sp.]|nr:thiamine pyrophosphate-dependent enzyme [Povalibacter sp.]